MLKIATKTKLNPEEAIKRAVMFFDLGAYGLRSKTSLPAALTLRETMVELMLSPVSRRRESPLNWNLRNGIIRLRNSFARFTDAALKVDQSTRMADMIPADIKIK